MRVNKRNAYTHIPANVDDRFTQGYERYESVILGKLAGKIAKPLMTRTDVYSNVLSAGNCSVIRCAFYILHTSYASPSAEISTVPHHHHHRHRHRHRHHHHYCRWASSSRGCEARRESRTRRAGGGGRRKGGWRAQRWTEKRISFQIKTSNSHARPRRMHPLYNLKRLPWALKHQIKTIASRVYDVMNDIGFSANF